MPYIVYIHITQNGMPNINSIHIEHTQNALMHGQTDRQMHK